jgi:hypothetical protein
MPGLFYGDNERCVLVLRGAALARRKSTRAVVEQSS